MKETQGQFLSEDGLRLHYRFYENPEAVKTMVILHGHGEHSGRYAKFPGYLSKEKLSVAVYDFRGAGQSEGREVYVSSFEEYIRDVSSFVAFLKEKHSVGGKITLLGHSLGGLAALHWAMRFPHRLESLILSSPCLGLRLPAPLILMNSLFNRIIPGMVYQNPVYPPHLTHNLAEVEQYKKDPFIKRKISVRLLSEMINYGNLTEKTPDLKFPFPVFVLMAGLEKVVDKERTIRIFNRIEAPVKRLQCFEGYYHEIFNELGQEKVFEALISCLRESGVSTSQDTGTIPHS